MTTRQLLAAPTAILVLTLALGSRAAAQDLAGPRAAPQWATIQPELPPSDTRWAATRPEPLTSGLVTAVRRRAPGTVLMIVGGAIAGAGILTDESLLIVGGVVVAGYGLYIYL